MMPSLRPEYLVGLIILGGALAAGGVVLTERSPVDSMNSTFSFGKTPYVEIANPSGFVNTDGITIGELVGKKVILVDFMTYSCINCQRTFPHVTAWYEKYKDDGLEIVAIHTPEFAFEKNIENVREAMQKNGIIYPVVLDNDYATWRAYDNNYWPRKYLIDIEGNIVYDHIGEGAYVETEQKIQQLLLERAEKVGVAPPETGVFVSAALAEVKERPKSPETYFGSLRNATLANGVPNKEGVQTFSEPRSYVKNALYFLGTWDITPEHAKALKDARIVFAYEAKEVYFVARADNPTTVTIFQDGQPLTISRGADVRPDGTLTIQNDQLYKIVLNPAIEAHTLEIRVEGAGLEAFTFTFG